MDKYAALGEALRADAQRQQREANEEMIRDEVATRIREFVTYSNGAVERAINDQAAAIIEMVRYHDRKDDDY